MDFSSGAGHLQLSKLPCGKSDSAMLRFFINALAQMLIVSSQYKQYHHCCVVLNILEWL